MLFSWELCVGARGCFYGKETRNSYCRDLPDGEGNDICEPIEKVAVSAGYEGLGDFLQRDKDEKDEGDRRDAPRQISNSEIWKGEIAEKPQDAEENNVSEFISVTSVMNERPERRAITEIRDDDDGDDE